MPYPDFIDVSNDVFVAASGTDTVTKSGCTQGALILVQSFIRTAGNFVDTTNITNIESLVGTDNSLNQLATAAVGAVSAGTHEIKLGRVIANGTCSIDVSDGGGATPLWCRFYEFTNVRNERFVTENNVAFPELADPGGTWGFNAATSTTITHNDIITTGLERLAASFICVDAQQALAEYSGETGGTWTKPVTEFASASGGGATIGIQTAEIASPGTISGGTITITSNEWSTVDFALIAGLTASVAWIGA